MNGKDNEPKDSDWLEIKKYLRKMSALIGIFGNLSGAAFVTIYFTFFDQSTAAEAGSFKDLIIPGIMFGFLVFLGTVFFRIWFRPLEKYVNLNINREPADQSLVLKARRKILNLPIVSAAASLFNWLLAAVFMTILVGFEMGLKGLTLEEGLYISRIFSGIIMGGIVTCTIVFFLTENFYRRVLPHFFPHGGLADVRRVFRLNLGLRIVITFLFASFIPMINLALLPFSRAKVAASADSGINIFNLDIQVLFVLGASLVLAVILSYLLSRTITKPVFEMQNAMGTVENGDLSVSVKVADNNELGMLAENFNQMIEGLRDRYQIKQSLAVAQEVQQSLLPEKNPEIDGLEIAGRILYSDETGGDYYDYIYPDDPADKKIGIVVGDVSGHGISAALLMASTRAFIRQRLSLPGEISSVVSDVNAQFSRDVEASGRFMTLFFLLIDYGRNHFEWVRAGHEPAIVYDPAADSFEELKGKGVALGIDGDFKYEAYKKEHFDRGKIILLCTDGIWEARNNSDEMFGKERIQQIIRDHHDKSTDILLDILIKNVEEFTDSAVPEDDITLVILKRKISV